MSEQQTTVISYGSQRIEMDAETSDRVLALLKDNGAPAPDVCPVALAYAAYQAVYWQTVFLEMMQTYQKQKEKKQ
jgi:hypothetical protein